MISRLQHNLTMAVFVALVGGLTTAYAEDGSPEKDRLDAVSRKAEHKALEDQLSKLKLEIGAIENKIKSLDVDAPKDDVTEKKDAKSKDEKDTSQDNNKKDQSVVVKKPVIKDDTLTIDIPSDDDVLKQLGTDIASIRKSLESIESALKRRSTSYPPKDDRGGQETNVKGRLTVNNKTSVTYSMVINGYLMDISPGSTVMRVPHKAVTTQLPPYEDFKTWNNWSNADVPEMVIDIR